MNKFFSLINQPDRHKTPASQEDIRRSISPASREINRSDGSEFLDDRIRMDEPRPIPHNNIREGELML